MPRDARAQDVAASRCETGILKPTNRDASRHTAHRPRAAFASPAAVMATTTTTTTTTTRIDRVAASSSRAASRRRSSTSTPKSATARSRTTVRRATTSDDDVADDASTSARARVERWRARARTMRAKILKGYLARLGARSDDCLEKDELVDRLAETWMTKCENFAITVPLRQLGNIGGNPRSGYALVTLDVGGDIGLCDFVIDTGATTALITPKALDMLDKDQVKEGAAVRGLTGTGETLRQKVSISEVRLGSKEFVLDAVVTDLTAVGLPATIGGLLGLDWLGNFEVEFDFEQSVITFWPPGSVKNGAVAVEDLVRVRLNQHPVGLKTVRCSLNGAELDAIVDMGSFFSVVNWMASTTAGIGPDSDKVKRGGLQVTGVDGKSMAMAMAPYDLRVLGDGEEDLTSTYQGMCCIGDLPAFAALGASVSPFMALGLDVIGRGRMVFNAKDNAMYLSKGDVTYGV